jgi:hypothetical protein
MRNETGCAKEPRSFWRRYVFSTNHKIIAVQYLITGLTFLAVGLVLALLMRWQLAHPWQPVPLIGKLLFPASDGAVTPELSRPSGQASRQERRVARRAEGRCISPRL